MIYGSTTGMCVLEEGVEASVINCNNDRANKQSKIDVLYCL
jgi:hypothetical protein